MPSSFINIPPDGPYVIADPDSDLDYAIATWLEGLTFGVVPTFSVSPSGPVLHDPAVNAGQVTVDGVVYQPNELATIWVKTMAAGTDYVVTCHATFSGGQVDDRSFTIRCRAR